jgi:cob(I)alamin adenosyltransferase
LKIYTRRGDRGETDLFGGGRVAKDHLRVEAYGAVDELNAALGLAAAVTRQVDLRQLVQQVQRLLFALGGTLATPDPHHREKSGVQGPLPEDVAELERRIDALEKELAPLRRFVLPGGCDAAASFHLARTVCRRAERRVVGLARVEDVGGTSLVFLNRLSDLLFTLARVENRRAGVADVEWEGAPRGR